MNNTVTMDVNSLHNLLRRVYFDGLSSGGITMAACLGLPDSAAFDAAQALVIQTVATPAFMAEVDRQLTARASGVNPPDRDHHSIVTVTRDGKTATRRVVGVKPEREWRE